MTIRDLLSETWLALSGNRLRTGLTMLGIVIGIGSVIALTGVGQGATASVTDSISSLGSNLLIVSPGASRRAGPVSGGFGSATTLTPEDAAALKSQLTDISGLVPELSSRYQVTTKGENTNTTVTGTEDSYPAIRNVTVAEGSFFTATQVKTAAKVAVIGPSTRDTLFGEGASAVGQTIKINKIEFKVIGVTASKGGTNTSGDDIIYIPLATAQRQLAGKTTLSSINIAASSADTVSIVQQQIKDILMIRHNITDSTKADFSVTNQADLQASLSSVTSTLTALLGAIAGISLLVGGIGIMNMMLTSVTERTREIGLRKAIGATQGDIAWQFLFESIVVTFIGGVIGLLLGWGAAVLVTKLGLVTAKVTTSSVLLACGVSAVVGIVFGYYPARRASLLKPIEALKYE